MKKHKFLPWLLLGIVLFHVIAFGIAFLLNQLDVKPAASPYSHRLFSDVSQLEEKLAPLNPEKTRDLYADDEDAAYGLCCRVEYNGAHYRVAGYVFPDALTAAKHYSCEIWGEKWTESRDEVMQFFKKSARTEFKPFGWAKHAVFHDRSVLLIESDDTGKDQLAEFENWLTEGFPLEYYTPEEQEAIDSITR